MFLKISIIYSAYWLKWTKAFKLEKEVNQIVSSLNSIEPNSSKIAFKKVLCQKRNLNLFKLNSQICKKINNYTKLPDLKQLLNNTLTLIWHLEFYDSKDRLLFKFNSIEQNVFEASCSIIWSDLTQLNNSHQTRIHNSQQTRIKINNISLPLTQLKI